MTEFFNEYGALLAQGTLDTVYMTVMATVFAYIIGLPLGIILFTTKKGGIAENKPINAVLGAVINVLRSVPFIILLVALFPVTRFIVGTIIGATSAIVPLVFAAAPFVARMVETSCEEIDTGVIEAARCMGATNWQIICKVLIVESIPAIIRGLSITTITLVGYSAMAGAVGAGGLGDIGIRYGYHKFQPDVMYVTVILLVIIVCVIQGVFNLCAKKIDKRNK
ncbi:MAG: methionine ABC transporter permease [Oscillospiraceae bacterium]